MRFPRLILTATIALALALSGCSKNATESTVDPSRPYNDADIATDMIRHHAQAL